MKKERKGHLWMLGRGMAFILAVALLMTSLPTWAMAETSGAQTETGGKAVHDYGKSGDDPATEEDESAVVANSDVMQSVQYQESTKFNLVVNETPVTTYKYQKSATAGSVYYHMDVARFSSDDAAPTFTITLKDDTVIKTVEVYPERYYPQDALHISEDGKTLTFQMSENLRYCIVNINGDIKDTKGKPQLAIINDPTETDKPDVNAANVLNFKEFSEQYLQEHPITDTVGAVCTPAGTATDTSANTAEEYTWSYQDGVYQSYTDSKVKFPNKRVRLSNDVTEAFQAALDKVKNDPTLDTIYFPAGTYIWSGLSIQDWDGDGADGPLTIYTDEDALMVNRLQECQEAMEPAIGIWNSSNITVSGRGIFDGQGTYNYTKDSADADKSCHQGGCMVVQSDHITFNDTYVRDVKQWNWECHTVNDITYNNIKGLSPYQHSWMDGLDLTSGKNVTVNSSFTMGNDDTFASGHYNPSDGFPANKMSSLLSGKTNADVASLNLSEEVTNAAAAAAVYNKDRLLWDTDDSENFTLNDSLGWSGCANAIRLGHSTKWKNNGTESYQLKSYTFNNFNSVLVAGYTSNSGGGDAIRVQNGNLGSNPDYQELIFNNCSFAGNNGSNIGAPIGGDTYHFNPVNIALNNCWFQDSTKAFSFNSIQNLAITNLYAAGRLVEYSSQINATYGSAIGNLTFTANGVNILENKLPSFTCPESSLTAYNDQPLIFYVKAEDEDEGDVIRYGDADLSEVEGAAFDQATGKFSWTPGSDQIDGDYKVTFTVYDHTNQAVTYPVTIHVNSYENHKLSTMVSEDAHVQTWKDEKANNYGSTVYLSAMKASDAGGLLGQNGSSNNASDSKLIYLKFDLAFIREQQSLFDQANLSMTLIALRLSANKGLDDSLKVAAVDDSSWTESGLTWNTRPVFATDDAALVKESASFNLGSIVQDKPSGVNQQINGTRVKVDITDLVNQALENNQDTLTLAVNETKGYECYFVSKEGENGTDAKGTGRFNNATAGMAPSIVLNLPAVFSMSGPEAMILKEGYKESESNSFQFAKDSAPSVELTGNTGNGKITWNGQTHQLEIAEGLTTGVYPVAIKATDAQNTTVESTFTLTVEEAENAPVVTSVSVRPGTAQILKGASQTFTAEVSGTNDPAKTVTWSVSGAKSGKTSITSEGILTVGSDETAAKLIVTATSTVTDTVFGTAEVTVIAPAVTAITVKPGTVKILKGSSQTFTAEVSGTDNPAKTVTWSVSGAKSKGTTINASGKLTVSKSETASELTVSATSTITKSVSGTAKVTLLTPVSTVSISKIKDQTYTGKALVPSVKIVYNSKTLKNKTDYTVSYKNNKAVGTATVTIKGIGKYSGTRTITFKINPKSTKLTAAVSAKKGILTVKWKKNTGVTGYQILYSTSSKFTKSTTRTVTVSKNKTTSSAIKKLKSSKKYYVKIRTYKKVGKTSYYSDWSSVKKAVIHK